jgi:hypothetical protein
MCVSILNPSLIVTGGSMTEASEQLIAGMREVVYSRSTPLATLPSTFQSFKPVPGPTPGSSEQASWLLNMFSSRKT